VAELWRYPVNGLQGEKLDQVRVLRHGFTGDHLYAIRDIASGRVLDPKSYQFSWGESVGRPSMLELAARISGPPEGSHSILIETSGQSLTWSSERDVNERLSGFLGGKLELVRFPRFAEARVRSGRTLHLLTTASLSRMKEVYPRGDFQSRRFRPNIVVETESGVDGFVEDGWIGKDVLAGSVRIHVEKSNVRCKVTTMSQPGIAEDPGILESIERGNNSSLGVMCTALQEGELRVGDPVRLS